MPQIRIGETTYDAKALESLPLKHLLTFKIDTQALGLPVSWSEIEAASQEIGELPDDAKNSHPHWELVFIAMIWATLLANGKDVRFRDVLEFSLDEIEFIADPEPEAAPDPTEGPEQAAPTASVPAE